MIRERGGVHTDHLTIMDVTSSCIYSNDAVNVIIPSRALVRFAYTRGITECARG